MSTPPNESTQPSNSTPVRSMDEPPQPKTPPRTTANAVPTSLGDTPARARSVDHHSYRNGSLNERRTAIVGDLGQSIPEVDLEFFFDNILPPLRNGLEVDQIVASLKSGGIIEGGRWKWFSIDPCKEAVPEPLAFQHVGDIFNSIIKAANEKSHGHEQMFTLRMTPNSAPVSERASRAKPDGYMILKEAEDKFGTNKKARRSWYDLALALEAKKSETDTNKRDDNVSKQIYSMQHTMSIDPCRRFTFGITIENASMRLWFCSRAVMMVTKTFDFIENYRGLVHIFLSLAFASKIELGWDPTLNVSIKDNVRYYHTEVEGEMYDTVEVLSDSGADGIIGRGTRAFKVIQRKTGIEYVLRDVWLEDDRKPEHKIHEELLRDIKDVAGSEAEEIVKNHLLTPKYQCKVMVDEQEDHTCKVMMRGAVPSFANTFDLVITEVSVNDATKSVAPSCASDKVVHLGTRAPRDATRKHIHHRIHYRVIFVEVAEPI
ncbi:hypothetical protein M0805_007974, partial [Coniferiporia weirii]